MKTNFEDMNISYFNTRTRALVKIEDGCFVFTTDHFSLYTLVGYDSGDDIATEQEEKPFPKIIFYIAALFTITGIGITIIIKQKKK